MNTKLNKNVNVFTATMLVGNPTVCIGYNSQILQLTAQEGKDLVKLLETAIEQAEPELSISDKFY